MTSADAHPLDDQSPDASAPGASRIDASPMVVLVHGAWHGAWCWAALQAELDRRAIPSLSIDLPGHGASTADLGSVHDDAAALAAVLDRLTADGHGPVVLVGHSYGGAVITQAAAGRSDIAHLAYIAAFALEPGESVLSCLGSLDRRDVELAAAMVPDPDGSATRLDPAAAGGALYGSCGGQVVAAALARVEAQSTASFTDPIDGAPRRTITSTYIVCSQDRAVHPDHQAAMAERCTNRVDLDTDHSPFLSATNDVADVITEIVTEIGRIP